MTIAVQPPQSTVPLFDLAAEAGVLGSIILDPPVMGGVRMFLRTPEMFYKEEHQTIFQVMSELDAAGQPIDAMILRSTLSNKGLLEEVGGMDYVVRLANAVPTSSHAEYYAAMVKEKWSLRVLLQSCHQTLNDIHNSGETADVILDRAAGRIFGIAENSLPSFPQRLSSVVNETVEMLSGSTKERITGIATGFFALDRVTCGLQRGEAIIIAARPSVGKTAFALNIVEHVGLEAGLPLVVFSAEMSNRLLVQRMLCSQAVIDSHRLRRGLLTAEEKRRVGEAAAKLQKDHIFLDDTPSPRLTDIITKARRLARREGIQLVMIDYLQLVKSTKKEKRLDEVAELSAGIKQLARELDVPVVCLCQLNRASETENRLPRCSDLRESGNIEQDADTVLLIHREAVLHRGDEEWIRNHPQEVNKAVVIVGKQRNGPCENVELVFLAGQTRFVNAAPVGGYDE